MAFEWNPFSPGLILLDSVTLGWAAFAVWLCVRRIGGRGDRPSRGDWIALAMGACLASFPWLVARVAVGGTLGVFLLARVCWTLATLALPLVAGGLAYRWRMRLLWVFVFLPLGVKLYGEAVEPRWLELESIELSVPGLRSELRIVHLSDLQTDGIGSMHERARETANAFDPHVVLFTGDVLNHPSLVDEVATYLGGFRHEAGHFFVSGNVDRGFDLEGLLSRAGVTLLDGQTQTLELGGAEVAVVGVGLAESRAAGALAARRVEFEDADVRIVMSHVPDTLFEARRLPVDLLLAGHTHGGQISTPFGPPFTLSSVPRTVASGGLHRVGDLPVIVSRGLGLEGHVAPRVRMFSRPHLVLLTLRPPGGRPST